MNAGPAHAKTGRSGSRQYEHPVEWLNMVPGADGLPCDSVTTILKGIGSNEGLIKWAGTEAAICAQTERDYIATLTHDEAVRYIGTAHTRKRDSAANRGTDVHTVAEKMLRGQPISKIERDIYGGYIDALEAWFLEHKPRPLAIEATCWNLPAGYAGTADVIGRIRGNRGLAVFDWKTSKDIYSEAAAQLAAYAACPIYTEGASTEPQGMPAITRGYVVRLCDDGRWEMREADLKAGKQLFDAALAVKKLNRVSAVYKAKKTKGDAGMASVEQKVAVLRQRATAIAEHDLGAFERLAADWPAGVLTFKNGGPQTIAEVALVERLVSQVELDFGVPF
jgi:hypothetical protein